MGKREKMLAVLVLGLAALFGVKFIFDDIWDSFAVKETRIATLTGEVSTKEKKIFEGAKANRKLADFKQRSLPSDPKLAGQLYQNWLLGLVDRVKFNDATVGSQTTTPSRGVFTRLSYTITGKGTLEQLTQFLYEFYSNDQLHQIRRLSVKPVDGGRLDIAASIDALVLPDAAHQDAVAAGPAHKLSFSLADYKQAITGRNLFAEYVPPPPDKPIVRDTPRPPDPPKPPSFDVAKYARLTGITEQDGRPQIWLMLFTTGKLLQLSEGETFEVGDMKGEVLHIGAENVDLLAGGKRLRMKIGDSLRDAKPSTDNELSTDGALRLN